ncbi:MAG: phosphotransferase [Clostridia bacterium]|nr:phosphotransferase [Clostridia bacterium]
MDSALLKEQYGLHLIDMRKSSIGAGSDTWFLTCEEGAYVLKFPAASSINHPESEPALCAFLRTHGIPACKFLTNRLGSALSQDADGRVFTVQERFAGVTPEWNTASDALLLESAELLGKIHQVLRAYPPLPEGIGAGFFRYMTPARARESYQRSLAIALRQGDAQSASELRWRMEWVERMPAPDFDLSRLTLRNTHGDYFISQFLCEDGHLTAVIDWTTACVHPVVWEIMRSFVYAAPECGEGTIDPARLAQYVRAYRRCGTLNDYDLQCLERLYFYQIAVCDYYGQAYASHAANRSIYLQQARHATKILMKNRKEDIPT